MKTIVKKTSLLISIITILYSCNNNEGPIHENKNRNGTINPSGGNSPTRQSIRNITLTMQGLGENNSYFHATSSTNLELSSGEFISKNGLFSIDVDFEVMNANRNDYRSEIRISSLTNNQFTEIHRNGTQAQITLSPSIYILTAKISHKNNHNDFRELRPTLIVQCPNSFANYEVDMSKLNISPVIENYQNHRYDDLPVGPLGRFVHDLSEVITSVPNGTNINKFSYTVDRQGDGIINSRPRNINSPITIYSNFADRGNDNQGREIKYRIYDDCYNFKDITVRHPTTFMTDLENFSIGSSVPSTYTDTQYNFASRRIPFIQAEIQSSNVDKRINGTYSIISHHNVSQRVKVNCVPQGGSRINVITEDQTDDLDGTMSNHIIGYYGMNLYIHGIAMNTNTREYSTTNARIVDLIYYYPGAADKFGGGHLTRQGESCSESNIQIDLIHISEVTSCGSNQTGDGRTTYRYALKADFTNCSLDNSNELLAMDVNTLERGELYCEFQTVVSNCTNNSPPTGPGNGSGGGTGNPDPPVDPTPGGPVPE